MYPDRPPAPRHCGDAARAATMHRRCSQAGTARRRALHRESLPSFSLLYTWVTRPSSTLTGVERSHNHAWCCRRAAKEIVSNRRIDRVNRRGRARANRGLVDPLGADRGLSITRYVLRIFSAPRIIAVRILL